MLQPSLESIFDFLLGRQQICSPQVLPHQAEAKLEEI